MASYPERLKQLRNERGLTQKQVAQYLGFKSERSYRHYEAGETDPPTKNTIKLAQLFDVSIDYLVGLSNNPKRR